MFSVKMYILGFFNSKKRVHHKPMQSCKSNLIVLFSHRHFLFSSHSRMGVAAVRTKDRGHYFYFTRILLKGDAGMAQWQESSPPTTGARFDSQTRRHMWVEFVVGSCPCSKVFSPGSPIFLPPQKPTLQIPIQSGNEDPLTK